MQKIHEFFMSIGYAILQFFQSIDTKNLLEALEIVGIGMLGIFIVIGVIIVVTTLLNKIFSK